MKFRWDKSALEKFFLYAYFAMLPLYLFPSGTPQISDFMVLFWSLAIIFQHASDINKSSAVGVRFVFLFTFYIAFVSCVWSLILSDPEPVFFSLFYVFNFIVFLAFLSVFSFDIEGYGWVFVKGLALSLTVCLILFFVNFDSGAARQKAGFNNPNQLAYYSLGALALSAILWEKITVSSVVLKFYTIAVSTLLVLSSFSLTATAALTFLLLGIAINYGLSLKKVIYLLFFCGGILVVSTLLLSSGLGEYLQDSWGTRISTIDRKTENVGEERGYLRIIEYSQYALFGAGEGARYRFGPENRHEIHSSIGTVVFSYGVPGLLLFLSILALVFSRASLGGKFVLLSLMMYALTHQGLRSSLFWACVAVSLIVGSQVNKRRHRRRTTSGAL